VGRVAPASNSVSVTVAVTAAVAVTVAVTVSDHAVILLSGRAVLDVFLPNRHRATTHLPKNAKGGNLGERNGRSSSGYEVGRRSCHQRGCSPLNLPLATTLMA